MSPLQRFEHYSNRIERFNDDLNAFIHLRLEAARLDAEAAEARHQAGESLSELDGKCVGIKANIAVSGLPHHAGIGAYRQDIAGADAHVVERLKAAGAIILGIVNMHEGALGATTDNVFFGRTKNPWGGTRTPGGSSGGSAAAVAAGLCDVALGSDTMGSVRIPSAYCGIQGHKPTKGRVPTDGVLALSHRLDHIGPHARQVSDLAACMGVLTGSPIKPDQIDLDTLKLGIWDGGEDVDLDQDVAEGFQAVRERLGACQQTSVYPPVYAYGKSRRAGLLVSEVEGTKIHKARLDQDPEGFSKLFRGLLAWGAARPESEVVAAYQHIADVRDAAPDFLREYPVILAPVAPQTAFKFCEDVPANQADLTAWANFAGLPAAAVYAGLSTEGRPLSVQVIGATGRDEHVLGVAAALEEVIGSPPYPPGFE